MSAGLVVVALLLALLVSSWAESWKAGITFLVIVAGVAGVIWFINWLSRERAPHVSRLPEEEGKKTLEMLQKFKTELLSKR